MTRSAVALAVLATCGCASALSWVSIGDWGDSEAKTYTATIMAEYAAKVDAEFVLGLGDNMYSTGVKSVDDPQFADKFENTFTGDSLSVPWYMCGGNHDYYGNITAQISYSDKSTRWNFEDFYYTKDLTGKDGTTLTLVSVDTWRLNGGDTFVAHDPVSGRSALRSYDLVHEAVSAGRLQAAARDQLFSTFELHDPSNPVALNEDAEQLQFIEDALSNSTADWKVVIGHFPVYSATLGEHGDTAYLKQALAPLLDKHGVDLYMNGHDHVQQHIFKNGTVHYVTNGNGARQHSEINTKYDGLQGYSGGSYGFMTHTANAANLTSNFYVNSGGAAKAMYTFTVSK